MQPAKIDHNTDAFLRRLIRTVERCGTCACWNSDDGKTGDCEKPGSPAYYAGIWTQAKDSCTVWEEGLRPQAAHPATS